MSKVVKLNGSATSVLSSFYKKRDAIFVLLPNIMSFIECYTTHAKENKGPKNANVAVLTEKLDTNTSKTYVSPENVRLC